MGSLRPLHVPGNRPKYEKKRLYTRKRPLLLHNNSDEAHIQLSRHFCYTTWMVRIFSRFLGTLGLGLVPVPVFALTNRTLTVNLGSNQPLTDVIGNVIEMLALTVIIFTTVLFLAGAFMMIISRGKDDLLSKGKDLMIQSLIGMAVVGGAYGLIRTLFWLIYVA